jgi:hypothetical protein
LKPLDQRPYKDDEGNVIYPNKFKKWVELIAQKRAIFQQITGPVDSAYVKEMNKYLKTLPPHDQDLIMQYTKELGKCENAKDKKKCEDGVNCTWIPKMLNSKNSDIEAANKIWNTYSHKIRRKIQWYLNETAPFISRVHAEGWNEYLNRQREVDVRMAILKTYNLWCSVVISLSASPLVGAIQQTLPSCPPIDINGMDPPDAISQKPKHIKEFEGPCPKMSFDMGIGGIDEDCHTTKFSIGRGPFKAFYEHVDDPLYAQDHNYTGKAGLNVGLDTWIGVDDEESGIKAGVNAKLEGTAWLKFDGNGTITGAGSEVAASGALGFKGEASGFEAGASVGTGVTVSTEWQVVAGQMQVVGNPATVKAGGGE